MMLLYCLFLLNCVFSSCFSGKSRIYIFSNFHLRVLHEDHSLRFMAASDSVPAERLEHSGFHHCHDRVNIFWPFLMFFGPFCFIHPIFSSFGFWYFGHVSCVIFFPFFPSCPSCLAKCKQRLHNIFIAKSDQKPKTKNGLNKTFATYFDRELNNEI